MADRTPPADLSRVRTYPLAERAHKVSVAQFAARVEVPDAENFDYAVV